MYTFQCKQAKRIIGVSLKEQSAHLIVRLVSGTARAEVQKIGSVVFIDTYPCGGFFKSIPSCYKVWWTPQMRMLRR